MMYAIRFLVSYAAALLGIFVFVTVIRISFFEVDLDRFSLAILLAIVSVTALLAVFPAILALRLETKHAKYLNVSKFGIFGMITGFIQSVIFIWIAYNGDFVPGFSYILSLALAGFIGGASFALAWNRLTKPAL